MAFPETIGNGVFLWQTAVVDQDPQKAIFKLQNQLHPDTIVGEIADGPYVYAPNRAFGNNITPAIVQDIRNRGMRFLSWGPIYGSYNIAQEGSVHGKQVQLLRPDAHVFDAETTFENNFKPALSSTITALLAGTADQVKQGLAMLAKIPDMATRVMTAFRKETDTPTIYCGYAWPLSYYDGRTVWHPPGLVRQMLHLMDGGLPMAYANSAVPGKAASQVTESYRQWSMYNPENKPLIMGTRSYTGDGTVVTPAIIQESYQAALAQKDHGVLGVAWWHAYSLMTIANPAVLAAYQNLPPWDGVAPPPVEPHAASFSAYGAQIDAEGSRSPKETQDKIVAAVKNLHQQLLSLGINLDAPPETFPAAVNASLSNAVHLLGSLAVPQPGQVGVAEIDPGRVTLGVQSKSFLMPLNVALLHARGALQSSN